MLTHILRSIICSQFDVAFGRERPDTKSTIKTHGGRDVSMDTASNMTHAMRVRFSLSTDEHEDGYRNLSILIFGGGSNYIGVYAKVDWSVRVKGKHIDGETPWICYAYHDSCWREDGVNSILWEFRDRLNTIEYLFNGKTGWYKDMDLNEEFIAELTAIRKQRYEQRGQLERWKKISELEYHAEGVHAS